MILPIERTETEKAYIMDLIPIMDRVQDRGTGYCTSCAMKIIGLGNMTRCPICGKELQISEANKPQCRIVVK